ncbi:hypothetical protein X726_32735 [Mesorhizobium sp. L103C105A0]|nr:hypothetical protein X726_32735 [Mesorhizobium sp. L103C105A0]
MLDLKGIGPECAAILYAEGLFRHFDNRQQVAAYARLAPTPWQSGSVQHEQGVSKAGTRRLRTTIERLSPQRTIGCATPTSSADHPLHMSV